MIVKSKFGVVFVPKVLKKLNPLVSGFKVCTAKLV
jgi:hypothetical protein